MQKYNRMMYLHVGDHNSWEIHDLVSGCQISIAIPHSWGADHLTHQPGLAPGHLPRCGQSSIPSRPILNTSTLWFQMSGVIPYLLLWFLEGVMTNKCLQDYRGSRECLVMLPHLWFNGINQPNLWVNLNISLNWNVRPLKKITHLVRSLVEVAIMYPETFKLALQPAPCESVAHSPHPTRGRDCGCPAATRANGPAVDPSHEAWRCGIFMFGGMV